MNRRGFLGALAALFGALTRPWKAASRYTWRAYGYDSATGILGELAQHSDETYGPEINRATYSFWRNMTPEQAQARVREAAFEVAPDFVRMIDARTTPWRPML